VTRKLTVDAASGTAAPRLDVFLAGALVGLPRRLVRRVIAEGDVRVNGRRAAKGLRLRPGEPWCLARRQDGRRRGQRALHRLAGQTVRGRAGAQVRRAWTGRTLPARSAPRRVWGMELATSVDASRRLKW